MEGNRTEDVLILAIESSCDETAAAVVKNGRTVCSNVITSQIETHTVYGGVVPEIASREHIKAINYVIERALAEAGTSLEEITAIAVRNEGKEAESSLDNRSLPRRSQPKIWDDDGAARESSGEVVYGSQGIKKAPKNKKPHQMTQIKLIR